jgi:hypothetical protein
LPELEPIHPIVLMGVLTLYGLTVLAEDADNWIMGRDIKDSADVPVVVPKRGALVAVDTIVKIIISAKLDIQVFPILVDKVLSVAKGTYQPAPLD